MDTNQFIPKEPIDLVMFQELEDIEQELRRQEQEHLSYIFAVMEEQAINDKLEMQEDLI
jgi:hypothetical protein